MMNGYQLVSFMLTVLHEGPRESAMRLAYHLKTSGHIMPASQKQAYKNQLMKLKSMMSK